MSRRRKHRLGKRRARPIRWRLELLLARFTMLVLTLLPPRLALLLGSGLGRGAYSLIGRRRRVALANLRIVYPEWSAERRRALAIENMKEFGRMLTEWTWLNRLTLDRILEIVEFRGLEHFEAAVAEGKGVIAVTAHYGHWEMIPTAIRARYPDQRIAVVGRTQRNPYLYRLITHRRSLGSELLDQDARAILRALRQGYAIGLLVDQYTSERRTGIPSPFLGRRVWTTPGPASFARRTGAPVLPVHIRRIEGLQHRLEFGPRIPVPRTDDRAADLASTTAHINDALGRVIRDHPEPWLWSHRRFRKSPDVEGDPYAEV
jgi:KDO2-lipid IV(A) lauroyltransferase